MTTRVLRLGEGFSPPAAEAATQTIVVYGGKGQGKTHLIGDMAEELDEAGQRFSAIDPMGVLWGLRYAKNGKGKGIEVLILGGRHGDIPIEPSAGTIVADLVADEEVNVVIDISRRGDGKMWSKAEKIRFVADYATRLFERQGERMRPIMQIIDEAGRFVPQMIPHGSPELSRCVGAIEQMVEEGRNVGIGVMLVTQRSARMNKSVSELAECMIAFRTVGPLSVNAIIDWLGDHIPKERWKEMVERIRSLPRGSALVVSPGWLEFEGVVAMRERRTFDSSATPKGGKAHVTGKGATPDLGRYLERMKETVERVKANDPAVLRRQLAEAQAQVKKHEAFVKEVDARTKKIDASLGKVPKRAVMPVFKDGAIKRIESVAEKMKAAASAIVMELGRVAEMQGKLLAETASARYSKPPLRAESAGYPRRALEGGGTRIVPLAAPPPEGLDDYAAVLLRTLVEREPLKLTRGQLAALAGKSARSSTYETALGTLRRAGYIVSSGEFILPTDAGRVAAGSVTPKSTAPEDLRASWLAVMPEYERALLQTMYGDPDIFGWTRDQIAEHAKKSATSSTFETALGTLRRNALIERRDGLYYLTAEAGA